MNINNKIDFKKCCYTVIEQSPITTQENEEKYFVHPDRRVEKKLARDYYDQRLKALESCEKAFLALIITEFTGKDIELIYQVGDYKELLHEHAVNEYYLACRGSNDDFLEGHTVEKEMHDFYKPVYEHIDANRI